MRKLFLSVALAFGLSLTAAQADGPIGLPIVPSTNGGLGANNGTLNGKLSVFNSDNTNGILALSAPSQIAPTTLTNGNTNEWPDPMFIPGYGYAVVWSCRSLPDVCYQPYKSNGSAPNGASTVVYSDPSLYGSFNIYGGPDQSGNITLFWQNLDGSNNLKHYYYSRLPFGSTTWSAPTSFSFSANCTPANGTSFALYGPTIIGAAGTSRIYEDAYCYISGGTSMTELMWHSDDGGVTWSFDSTVGTFSVSSTGINPDEMACINNDDNHLICVARMQPGASYTAGLGFYQIVGTLNGTSAVTWGSAVAFYPFEGDETSVGATGPWLFKFIGTNGYTQIGLSYYNRVDNRVEVIYGGAKDLENGPTAWASPPATITPATCASMCGEAAMSTNGISANSWGFYYSDNGGATTALYPIQAPVQNTLVPMSQNSTIFPANITIQSTSGLIAGLSGANESASTLTIRAPSSNGSGNVGGNLILQAGNGGSGAGRGYIAIASNGESASLGPSSSIGTPAAHQFYIGENVKIQPFAGDGNIFVATNAANSLNILTINTATNVSTFAGNVTDTDTIGNDAVDFGSTNSSGGYVAVRNGSATVVAKMDGRIAFPVQSPSYLDTTFYSAAGTALPTCNASAEGLHATVSDATAPTYHGTYTSGGTVISPVFCNGSAWITN